VREHVVRTEADQLGPLASVQRLHGRQEPFYRGDPVVNDALDAQIQKQKQESFNDPSSASDEEALGILITHHFSWNGDAILQVAGAELEDANFHTEAERVDEMRKRARMSTRQLCKRIGIARGRNAFAVAVLKLVMEW
jgi:hypothetical protein